MISTSAAHEVRGSARLVFVSKSCSSDRRAADDRRPSHPSWRAADRASRAAAAAPSRRSAASNGPALPGPRSTRAVSPPPATFVTKPTLVCDLRLGALDRREHEVAGAERLADVGAARCAARPAAGRRSRARARRRRGSASRPGRAALVPPTAACEPGGERLRAVVAVRPVEQRVRARVELVEAGAELVAAGREAAASAARRSGRCRRELCRCRPRACSSASRAPRARSRSAARGDRVRGQRRREPTRVRLRRCRALSAARRSSPERRCTRGSAETAGSAMAEPSSRSTYCTSDGSPSSGSISCCADVPVGVDQRVAAAR